jgi:GntR family transcriptional regulator
MRYVTGVPDFDLAGDEYVYAAVADHIAARIAAGELAPGTRLPAERALATEYGVAVGTARRAVRELSSRGLVRVLPGRGTFVTRRLPAYASLAVSSASLSSSVPRKMTPIRQPDTR